MNIEKISQIIGSKEISFETGKMAKLADGSLTVKCGGTVILVTAVSALKLRDGQDFFPLSVEYKEKAAAAGKIPGGFFKREGRPTEKEILTCRMTDRPLRPLFPKDYLYDTQIAAFLLSADGENDSDILAMNGASAALCISDIPFAGPIGAVRIGRVDNQFIVNPTNEERENSDIDLVYVGNKTDVIMIEGAANEIPEEEFKSALDFAQQNVVLLIEAQEKLIEKAGKQKREYTPVVIRQEILDTAYEIAGDKIEDAIYNPSKVERSKAVNAIKENVKSAIIEKFPETTDFEINQAFDFLQKKAFRKSILENGKRADGRGIDEIRKIGSEIDTLPKTVHGSALFSRGETQALALTTLAPIDQAQFFDNYTGGETSKNFILHYNFPPFSVGETGRMGGLNRREIGHGALAERSIVPVLPNETDFPYAMRVTSEVMESNGSTSMASVCSGSLSLMAAGVPITKHVAGISVGLVTDHEKYLTMLDIIGSEDFFGDMDFKLCGTEDGVTGYQLDLKLPGVPLQILKEAIDKAHTARLNILDIMKNTISSPAKISEYAPRIEKIKIDPDKIGSIIGSGGKTIRGIQDETGVEINIDDDGTINLYGAQKEAVERAKEIIHDLTAEIEVDTIYNGKIVGVTNFGAFMEVLPGQDGMIHVSELSTFRVNAPEDVVKVGDMVHAKCIGIDDKGRVKMSRKAAMEERGEHEDAPENYPSHPPRDNNRGDRRNDRPRNNRNQRGRNNNRR